MSAPEIKSDPVRDLRAALSHGSSHDSLAEAIRANQRCRLTCSYAQSGLNCYDVADCSFRVGNSAWQS